LLQRPLKIVRSGSKPLSDAVLETQEMMTIVRKRNPPLLLLRNQKRKRPTRLLLSNPPK